MVLHDSETIAGLVAFVALMLLLFFCYACDLHRLVDCQSNRVTNTILSDRRHPNVHLSSKVIASLPIFVYDGSTNHDDKFECAVCLMEFQAGDVGRILPRCRHVFHTECIDMWFETHSTCPLCRVTVESTDGSLQYV